ncbi:MAG: exodeoxyribonuclease large subunit [Blastocatellia bacterium]|jgi:exodeoxyribonuclease VII large subunit|nr:exodeoxyribonuclease large subunit [Blastocatellia bacterium]
MNQPLLSALFDKPERRPLTVSELTGAIRGALESRFAAAWVEGEISNFRAHSSGHWYFTLKDEGAQLRSVCFRTNNQRIRFRPADGLLVRARGRVSVYESKGEYQLVVDAIDPVGAGALRIAFEQTKARLQAEGLFAAELKRSLPVFPRRIGIVTSPSGAALRDILNVISRRTRTVHVLFAPARVQGEGAAREVARAVAFLNEYQARMLREGRTEDAIDVMIVGRGGGSAEDLWAFNEEEVARAFRASLIPVISAVGHETDFTIADFAADLRAPTPSAAAELVAAREDEICNLIGDLIRNLSRVIHYRISDSRTRVQQLTMSTAFNEVRGRLHQAILTSDDAGHRLETLMTGMLQRAQRRMDAVAHRLSPAQLRAHVAANKGRFENAEKARDAAIVARMELARGRLGLAAAALDAMSPLAVLERGYAIAQDANGRVVRDAAAVSPGDALRLRLWKGTLKCRVETLGES